VLLLWQLPPLIDKQKSTLFSFFCLSQHDFLPISSYLNEGYWKALYLPPCSVWLFDLCLLLLRGRLSLSRLPVWLQWLQWYNGGWPSARLFGWSAADWSRPATNKSISSKRKRKSIVLLRKEIMNKLVVDLLQRKGLGYWKVLKKRCIQKGKIFPQLTNSMVLAK